MCHIYLLTRIIFWRFLQVSSRASIVNQVYGFGPTLKDLIFLSSSANWLKSVSAALREALNWSWASLKALISSTELHLTGSVKSSSAFSNHELEAEAFLAKVRYRSSTWRYCSCRRRRRCLRASESFSNLCHLWKHFINQLLQILTNSTNLTGLPPNPWSI